MAISPVRDVSVTAGCAACGSPVPAGRARRYCTAACRQDAYRRRHQSAVTPAPLPARRSRLEGTVYACSSCQNRYLAEQWCPDCARRVPPTRSRRNMPQLRRDHARQRAPRRGVDRHGPQELASIRHPTHYEDISTVSGEAQPDFGEPCRDPVNCVAPTWAGVLSRVLARPVCGCPNPPAVSGRCNVHDRLQAG